MLNLRSILADKAIIALLSLAAMIPMMAGQIDLTVGYGIVLWHILAISLQTRSACPGRVAVRRSCCCSAASLGLLNGLLVEVARIDSFIATLGTGTVLYAHRALAHRRPAGHRRAAERLPRAQHAAASSACRSPPSTCWRSRSCCGSCRVPADRPLPLRHRRQPAGGGAERHPGPPLRHRRLRRLGPARRRSPASCSPRSCASARPASAWNSCCRRWSAPSSARPRSSPAGSMSGAR